MNKDSTTTHTKKSGTSNHDVGGHGGEDVVDRAKVALDRAVTSGRSALAEVDTQIENRPYVAMTVAAGVAFGLGAMMGSRLVRWAAVIGGGYALTKLWNSPAGKRVKEIVQDETDKLVDAVSKS